MSATRALTTLETARASANNGCNCGACQELRGTLAALESALTEHQAAEARERTRRGMERRALGLP